MRYSIIIASLLCTTLAVAQQATQTNPNETASPAISEPDVQNRPAEQRNSDRPSTFRDPTDPAITTDQSKSADKRVLRASEIIGTDVQNRAGESLGEIHDLVIEPSEGRIAYAAVSMGGFLGVGDKLFAVPWEAIESRKDQDQHVAILDVNKETLENAQGFDEENWPDMANAQWRRSALSPVAAASRGGTADTATG
jgi:sporulation protein YlmC with PRC-barrel domain